MPTNADDQSTGLRDHPIMILALVFNDLLLFGAGLACAYLHLTGRSK